MTSVFVDTRSDKEVLRIWEDLNITINQRDTSVISIQHQDYKTTWLLKDIDYHLNPDGQDNDDEHCYTEAHMTTYYYVYPHCKLARMISDELKEDDKEEE